MLQLKNIEIRNGNYKVSADLAIESGSIVGVVGPSGSGKSTLHSGIAGFLPLETGEIYFENTRIDQLKPHERPITSMFQSHNLFPRMRIDENIRLGAPNLSDSELETVAIEVGIFDILDRFPRDISGGQAARAAIVRSMLQNKSIWLLDEPFSTLGPKQGRDLRAIIKKIVKSQGKTLLVISHNPTDFADWADSIVWIRDGKVEKPQKTSDFLNFPDPMVQEYL